MQPLSGAGVSEAVWFWQRTVSPHMAGLATALAARGIPTTYVTQAMLSADRVALGWEIPALGDVRLLVAADRSAVLAAVAEAPSDSLHICQGLRANGLVEIAQRALAARHLRQWVVMETVDDASWKGLLRRGLYRAHLLRSRDRVGAFLATGAETPDWLIARGAPRERVFPFAYFLSPPKTIASPTTADGRFRVLFVGQLVHRKRLDLLIDALGRVGSDAVELVVAGAGELEAELRERAFRTLGDRVRWLGRQSQGSIAAIMASADCLVLPSRFDGWGAVASEALLVGTPVICSAGCGCREAVERSGGAVFATGDVDDLAARIQKKMALGRVSPSARTSLATWARALGAEAGADYLRDIIAYCSGQQQPRPIAPWLKTPAWELIH